MVCGAKIIKYSLHEQCLTILLWKNASTENDHNLLKENKQK